jgi:hypothetical protein
MVINVSGILFDAGNHMRRYIMPILRRMQCICWSDLVSALVMREWMRIPIVEVLGVFSSKNNTISSGPHSHFNSVLRGVSSFFLLQKIVFITPCIIVMATTILVVTVGGRASRNSHFLYVYMITHSGKARINVRLEEDQDSTSCRGKNFCTPPVLAPGLLQAHVQWVPGCFPEREGA